MDSNRITKTPALNKRPAPEGKEQGSMAARGYERLDGGKKERASGLYPASGSDRRGLSEPVYPSTPVYDDY